MAAKQPSASASASAGNHNRKRARGAQPGNANASRHNVYSRHFSPDEIGRFLEAAFDSESLADEIGLARVTNDRAVARMAQPELSHEEFITLSKLVLEGAGRVGNLLRQQRTISGQAGDSLADAIATALDQIGEQLGIET